MTEDFISLRNKMLLSGLIRSNGFKAPRSDAKKYDAIKLEIIKSAIPELLNFQTLDERLWALFHLKTEKQICKCGKSLTFNPQHKRYPRYCSKSCTYKDENFRKKLKLAHAKIDKVKKLEKTKYTCLTRYGVPYAASASHVKNKIKDTMLKRHGVNSSFSKGKIRDKFERANLESHGHKNLFTYGSKEFTNLMINRFGNEHFNKTEIGRKAKRKTSKLNYNSERFDLRIDEIKVNENVVPLFPLEDYSSVLGKMKWKHIICGNEFISNLDNGKIPSCPICWGSRSKVEAVVRKWLNDCGTEVYFSDRSILKPYELDIVFPSKLVAIEINGAYWHHSDSSTLSLLDKTRLASVKGYRLIHLWDYEIINKPEQVKSIIKSILGRFDRIIYARNCTIVNLSWKDSKAFLDDNHIQGSGSPTRLNYGLVYRNELVAIMTFGKSRFNKLVENELFRYCSKLNTKIIGGASKLFHEAPSGKMISYCDKRLFSGNLYEMLGFTRDKVSKPGYVWYNKREILNRISTQKHKLKYKENFNFNPLLTEEENMKNNGYLKLIDCGQESFIKDVN